ncbi:MAG: aminopeptidase P family N-terminal domain-containing protein [Pseudomonadota bacterium]
MSQTMPEIFNRPGAVPEPFGRDVRKMTSPFTEADYLARFDAVKASMEDAGVDCFFATEAGNLCYLSGYMAESAYVPQGLALYKDEKFPKLYARKMDTPAGMYMCYMPNDYIIGYPEWIVGDEEASALDYIIEAITTPKGVKRLGLELDAMSAASVNRLQKNFPNIDIIDMSDVVMRHRLVKTPKEIKLHREAGVIADAVMQQCGESFRAGRRECDIA